MSNAKIIHGRFYGTGKRKNAVARVFLSPGTGTVTVNGRTFEDYFPRDILRMIIEQPFGVIERNGQYDVRINVHGGGIAAQAQAVRHGISRALNRVDIEKYRIPLKRAGFLTRDARVVERKKYGRPGARRRFQFSKR